MQLEAIHQFKYPELIPKKIRMSEDVIDDNMLNEIREQVNIGLPEYARVKPIDWDFWEKARFTFAYLFGKLNTEPHGKSVSVKNRNGLEPYRLVSQSVDALPTIAKFYLDCRSPHLPRSTQKLNT